MNKIDELIKKLSPDGVEYKKLEDISTFERGKGFKKEDKGTGDSPIIFYGELYTTYGNYIDEIVSFVDEKKVANKIYVNRGDIVLPISSTTAEAQIGKASVVRVDRAILGSDAIVIHHNINSSYLMYYINSKIFEFYKMKCVSGTTIRHLAPKEMMQIKVAVPPLEVQCEIVHILDDFTLLSAELSAELKARQKQYEYYFNKILNSSKYPKMKLGEIGQVRMCKRILKSQTNNIKGIPFYKIGTFGKEPDAYIDEQTFNEYREKYSYPKKGDILISCSGTIGRTVIFDGEPAYFQDSNIVWLEHDGTKVINEYLFYCYKTNLWSISTGGTIARLYNENVLKAEIPVPPIEEQQKIVDKLNRFYKICNDISEGLPAEIEARQKQYEYYRDKLLTFKELVNEG